MGSAERFESDLAQLRPITTHKRTQHCYIYNQVLTGWMARVGKGHGTVMPDGLRQGVIDAKRV